MTDLELTPEEKKIAEEVWRESPDLNIITRKVFNNDILDGRSKQGRAVRKFLVEAGLNYDTTKVYKKDDVVLTPDQKEKILGMAGDLTVFQIAKEIFPNVQIKSALQKECVAVMHFIRIEAPEKIKKEESAVGLGYAPPKNYPDAILKINKATHQELTNQKLSSENRRNIGAYIRYMNMPSVIQIIASYGDIEDREMFEGDFTAKTWDKPDLTADEVTLYIGLCRDLVHQKHLNVMKNSLQKRMSDAIESDNSKELSMSLAENMKTVNEDYNNVSKRIESVIGKLNGERAKRIAAQGEKSSSFLALVESFQQEDERRRLLTIAKARREKTKDEVNRLEGLDEWKARILGVSKTEVL